jgi:ribosomal protein L40E
VIPFMTAYVTGQRLVRKALSMPPAPTIAGSDLDRSVVDLEERVNRLMMVAEAMWEMLETHGHTQEELIERVAGVEARAQERAAQAIHCASCGARLSLNHPKCQICGADSGLAPPTLGY